MTSYAPCPQCQGTNATPIRFTWWGGLLGPKLLTHVKCSQCRTAYNGKSGKSNTAAIMIYFAVIFVIVFAIGIVAALSK